MRGRTFLFNDAFNTFYLQLYGAGHMVKDHSDNQIGNPLPPLHKLFFRFRTGQVRSECLTCTFRASCWTSRTPVTGTCTGLRQFLCPGQAFRLVARGRLYALSHRQDSTYHGFCYTSRVAQWVNHGGLIRRSIAY